MTVPKTKLMANLKQSYKTTVSLIRKDRRILYPFLIFAFLETLSLIFLYLAPRVPLRTAMGPVITTFWGEKFLHYPQNFILLPKLANYARMALSVFIGSVLTGIAVCFLYKKPLSIALKKYINLFIIVLLLTSIYYFLNKAIYVSLVKYFNAGHQKFLFVGPRWWLGPFNILISQGLALFLQAIFAYAVPIVILSEKKFFGAIIGSCVFFFKNFITTLFLIAIPMLAAVPLIFLNYNGTFLMTTFSPEIILWLGILGIVVNSLILDPIITLTTAAFYAEKRGA